MHDIYAIIKCSCYDINNIASERNNKWDFHIWFNRIIYGYCWCNNIIHIKDRLVFLLYTFQKREPSAYAYVNIIHRTIIVSINTTIPSLILSSNDNGVTNIKKNVAIIIPAIINPISSSMINIFCVSTKKLPL